VDSVSLWTLKEWNVSFSKRKNCWRPKMLHNYYRWLSWVTYLKFSKTGITLPEMQVPCKVSCSLIIFTVAMVSQGMYALRHCTEDKYTYVNIFCICLSLFPQ
jgi:hypothetical protein